MAVGGDGTVLGLEGVRAPPGGMVKGDDKVGKSPWLWSGMGGDPQREVRRQEAGAGR